MENYLTDDERVELRSKYKADNLRDAPANIKDKTLITNYGTEEQKQRLEADEAVGGEKSKGEEIEAGNQAEPAGNENSGELKATTDDAEQKAFAREFNKFVSLHGHAPDKNATIEDLRSLNLAKEQEVELDASNLEDLEPAKNAKGIETIALVNKETGARINPSVFTYENFIKKAQPEWVPVSSVKPKEIQK